MTIYLIDTNILMSLESYDSLLARCEGKITIPMYVLEELDNLKNKEGDKGFKARRALRNIEKYADDIEIYLPTDDEYRYFLPACWSTGKMDNEIINSAAILKSAGNKVKVLSNDLNVRLKCESVEIDAESYYEIIEINSGWLQVNLSEEECLSLDDEAIASMLKTGQYLLVDEKHTGDLFAIYSRDNENKIRCVVPRHIYSSHFGRIEALDEFQMCAIDSLYKDNLTVITGKAGSGKTLLSLSYALQEVLSGKRSKLIIFANPVKTRGSEQLGYYPGDRTEKLMQNSVGAMLVSKFGGDPMAVDQLIQDGMLEILPFSDIRGFEVSESQIMYISEAQNLNVDLAKLAIQRCAEGAKIILEGDPQTQVDHYSFEGNQNGLRRVIEVFEGTEGFSHIYLPNIRRSKIADLADKM